MLHPRDRQNRLSFFYRNNIKKCGGIVPNIVPIELQKPLFYAAVGKEKAQIFFAFGEKYLTKSCNKYRK